MSIRNPWSRVVVTTVLSLPISLLFPGMSLADSSSSEATSNAQSLHVCACQTSFSHPGDETSPEPQPAGFEIDLLRGFSESVGRPLEVEWLVPCRGLQAGLESGRCDIAAARITWTEERATRYTLSSGYLPVRLALVERSDAERNTAGGEDKSLRVASLEGTLYLKAASKLDGAEVLAASSEADMFEQVASGAADALVCDTTVVLDHLDAFPGLKVSRFLGDRSHYSFALQPGSDLSDDLDSYLASIRADGRYRQLLIEHFGAELADMLTDTDE